MSSLQGNSLSPPGVAGVTVSTLLTIEVTFQNPRGGFKFVEEENVKVHIGKIFIDLLICDEFRVGITIITIKIKIIAIIITIIKPNIRKCLK